MNNHPSIQPNIILTRQGKLATESLIAKINALNNNGILYKFINNYYNLPISVLSPDINGKLDPNLKVFLPLKYKNIDKEMAHNLSESGIYMFYHKNGKIAIGSTMNFRRRLMDHINSFRGHRTMHNLHIYTKENGGLSNITWSPIIITPNFFKLFYNLYPIVTLDKNELNVLRAFTKFMPRVLEQSYISYYKPELNGNISKNVIFNLGLDTESVISAENVVSKDNSRINIYRALDKNKNILAYSYSMNGLASILNISLAGLKYHLGRDSYIYIKSVNSDVSITKEG